MLVPVAEACAPAVSETADDRSSFLLVAFDVSLPHPKRIFREMNGTQEGKYALSVFVGKIRARICN